VHSEQGTAHLNGEYTVYGEVIEGLDVLDKIATVQTGTASRPVEDVKIISVSIVK
jgi:cyclophilin family peptidyl-prolyl cis-trans isomerase